jgi:phospholipid/cholesterol/gamma-HCH transport system substrate-binding protein
MHRPRVNPMISGVITSIVLFVVMAAIFVSGAPSGPQIQLPWNPKTTLHVQLANADALAPRASVEIAGVKVGEVQSVDAKGTLAVATLQITHLYSDIHSDATVYLRAHGLFGPKYIDIVPGTSGAPVVPDGGTIAVGQTVQPVDLDAILQALQSPEQQNLRTTIVELGQAASGRGDDVQHLLAAATSLTRVLDSPIRAIDAVGPQLSDMLVKDESFNAYFAQTPLDQLVANSEQTFQAFAANAGHLQSVLTNADSDLTTLDNSLNGETGNLSGLIHQLGKKGGTVDQFTKLSYLLGLFGANLTGKEARLGTDPASLDVTSGIISAITNIASAFAYSDPCPVQSAPTASLNDNHCSVSPDGRQHYLQVHLYHWPPSIGPNESSVNQRATGRFAGNQMSSFGSLLAS